jgi:transposase InsO family protein
MPWQTKDLSTMKQEAVEFALQGGANRREIARRYGISAPSLYKWIERYRSQGIEGLQDNARRPLHSPKRTGTELESLILELRDKHPYWGGRKLRRRLQDLGHKRLPATSTITDILRRHGRLNPTHPSAQGPWQRFEYPSPNQLWQMDFKGPLLTVHTGRCDPFTVLDDHSRFSLCIEPCKNQQLPSVKEALEQAFGRYGLPERILCDNGTPWRGAQEACRYTQLGVWLLQLGVELIHGRVCHPQTQGKEERFHGTFALEVLGQTTVWRDHQHCRERFEEFRYTYNFERPHQALGLDTPASHYQASRRVLPAKLPQPQYLDSDQVRLVRAKGEVRFKGHWLYAGQAFAGLPIAFRATQNDSLFEVFFSWKRIGQLDLRLLPEDKNSRLALCSKATDLRFEDSQNLPNANHSNLPLRSKPAVKDAQRRNGINGGDPRSGA